MLPTIGYHLTARFGQSSGLWSSHHTGLDFAAPTGNPIFAIANGVITAAGYDGSYGNKTVETLADGTEIWYCHQLVHGVSVGDKVTAPARSSAPSAPPATSPARTSTSRSTPAAATRSTRTPRFLLHGLSALRLLRAKWRDPGTER